MAAIFGSWHCFNRFLLRVSIIRSEISFVSRLHVHIVRIISFLHLFKLFVLTFFYIPDWINSRKNKKRDETIHESFAGNTQIPFPLFLKKKRRRRRRLFPRSIQLHSVSNKRYVPRIPRDKERPRSSLIGRWRNRRFRHYHHGQRVDPLSRPGGRLKYCQVADISHGLTEWLPFLAGS